MNLLKRYRIIKNIFLGISFLGVFSVQGMLQRNNRFIEAGLSNATLIEPGTTNFSTIEITQPGIYLLARDLVFTPTIPQPAIRIKTSGVQLDLNKRNVIQAVPTPGVSSIVVDPDLTGIQIRNGFVLQFTSTAILFNEGVSFIQMQNVNIKNCTHCALDFAGTSSVSRVSSGILERISIVECATAGTADCVLNASFADNIAFIGVSAANCGNQTIDMFIFKFSNSTECQLLQPTLLDNLGAKLTGVDLIACEDFVSLEARIVNNCAMGTGKEFCGIRLTNSSKSNIFKLPLVLNNFSMDGDLIGIDMGDGCEGNFFFRSQVIENTGNSVIGCRFIGTGTPSGNFNNILVRSFILRNNATTGDSLGVVISRSDQGILKRNAIGYNTSDAGIATGIQFESGTGGDLWGVLDCEIFKNFGVDDASSFGIYVQTGTNNTFIQNVAFQNGITLTNQLNGVPAGSISLVLPDDINAATAPWTNLGVSSGI